MDEETVEPVKKARKERSDKGKPRRARKVAAVPPMFTAAPEPEAPIHVLVHLRNGATAEFGCARRTVENGFHVFFYPSEIDRYRETRREFAVSEIVEIEITEARQPVAPVIRYDVNTEVLGRAQVATVASAGPQIHSVRKHAAGVLGALANSAGPIKMDTMPDLNIGSGGKVSFGDSEA